MSGRVVRFGWVDLGDARLCAGCTDLLQEPVGIFGEKVEAVSRVD